MTEGGDNGWWCVQDGTAILEQSLALQRHFIFLNTLELCLLLVMLFPLKRVAREVTVQVNLEIVGLVSFLFCVLFCLSFTCSAIAVGTITDTLFLVSAEYSMVQ